MPYCVFRNRMGENRGRDNRRRQCVLFDKNLKSNDTSINLETDSSLNIKAYSKNFTNNKKG